MDLRLWKCYVRAFHRLSQYDIYDVRPKDERYYLWWPLDYSLQHHCEVVFYYSLYSKKIFCNGISMMSCIVWVFRLGGILNIAETQDNWVYHCNTIYVQFINWSPNKMKIFLILWGYLHMLKKTTFLPTSDVLLSTFYVVKLLTC